MEDIEKDMKPRFIGETWRKYSTETSKQKATYGLFECQYCGEEFKCLVQSVKSGSTKSCGCLLGIKHGLTYNKFYKTWNGMLQRCTNPNHKAYKDYGGRGITVCEDWLDVATFLKYAEATYPNVFGYTLDRIDNDKGYSPDNCRWSDKTTQAINQRIKKNNTSGYVGVSYYDRDGKWEAYISINNARKRIGYFKDKIEAVLARDNYIVENKLPHKLSILNTGL